MKILDAVIFNEKYEAFYIIDHPSSKAFVLIELKYEYDELRRQAFPVESIHLMNAHQGCGRCLWVGRDTIKPSESIALICDDLIEKLRKNETI